LVLNRLISDPLVLVFVQAAIAAAAALVIAWLARLRGIDLFADLLVAVARGISQIVVVGFILMVLLRGPWWTSPFVLFGMIIAAGRTSGRRAKRFPEAFRIATYSIGLGAGSMILIMTVLGVIDIAVSALVPIGSMLIANAMNANALALERFRSEVEAHRGEIETALALGAAPGVTVAPYLRSAIRASLIPPVDSLRSLGIVWIPGVMAGMVLSGSSPVHASVYQFVVLVMIFAASGLTCLISTHYMAARAFTKAEQLVVGR
jgi:putative ABC transport system permease protein